MFRAVSCSSSGGQIVLLQHTSYILYQYICYIIILNMFRAVPCSLSGGQIVLLQPLVSSLSVNGRTVCRLNRATLYERSHSVNTRRKDTNSKSQ